MMSIAVLVYSKTGNTKQIAVRIKQVCEKRSYKVDIVPIEPQNQPGFLKAGYSAIRQKTLPITNEALDVSSYELVFIGSPVWAGKPAPFIKSMLEKTKGFKKTKSAVFITCAGGEKKDSKVITLLQRYLQDKDAVVSDASLIVHMSKNGKIKKEIPSFQDFINTVLPSE